MPYDYFLSLKLIYFTKHVYLLALTENSYT